MLPVASPISEGGEGEWLATELRRVTNIKESVKLLMQTVNAKRTHVPASPNTRKRHAKRQTPV